MSNYTKETFKGIFNEHYNALCNYAYSFLNSHELAEDTVQDVFLKLWNNKAKLPAKEELTPYLFTSVKNKALETIRKTRSEANKIMNMPLPSQEIHISNNDHTSENFMLKEKLNKLVRQLPTKCRDIFVLSKVDGLTYEEIAKLRKISKKTVENHMTNAFKYFRKSLENKR